MSRRSTLRYIRADEGIAAFETAIWLLVLVPALFNIVNLSAYVYQRMQVENAAQMAAAAAWTACSAPPSDPGCPTMEDAIDRALASTSLDTGVTEKPSTRKEGYYCPSTSTKKLISNATAADPTICASGAAAGYYVTITAQYTYTPFISVASLVSLLPTTISHTTWTRLK